MYKVYFLEHTSGSYRCEVGKRKPRLKEWKVVEQVSISTDFLPIPAELVLEFFKAGCRFMRREYGKRET